MPSDISLLILIGAALAGGVITWFLVRRRLPADAVAMIAQMAAEVRAVRAGCAGAVASVGRGIRPRPEGG